MTQGERKKISGPQELAQQVAGLAQAIVAAHGSDDLPALVGIRTGGAHLALRIQREMERLTGRPVAAGVIDINLYRDDWTLLHTKPKVGKTEIAFPVDNRVVVLVDDVIFTGRTIRAALDAVIDFGRPRRMELAVLVDRGHRELPIQPDYTALTLATEYSQAVDVLFVESGQPEDGVVLLEG